MELQVPGFGSFVWYHVPIRKPDKQRKYKTGVLHRNNHPGIANVEIRTKIHVIKKKKPLFRQKKGRSTWLRSNIPQSNKKSKVLVKIQNTCSGILQTTGRQKKSCPP